MLAKKILFSHDTNKYLKQIRKKRGEDAFKTFIRSNKISMGMQILRKGEDYGEPAHNNTEVYFALKGNAKLRIGKRTYQVSPGMAMYVPRKVPHKFYGVRNEFVFLFIFAGEDD